MNVETRLCVDMEMIGDELRHSGVDAVWTKDETWVDGRWSRNRRVLHATVSAALHDAGGCETSTCLDQLIRRYPGPMRVKQGDGKGGHILCRCKMSTGGTGECLRQG